MLTKNLNTNESQDSGSIRHFASSIVTTATLAAAMISFSQGLSLKVVPKKLSDGIKLIKYDNELTFSADSVLLNVLSDIEKIQILKDLYNYFSGSEAGFPKEFAEVFHENLEDLLA